MKHLGLVLMLIMLFCSPAGARSQFSRSAAQSSTTSDIVPLPASCGRLLPANNSNTSCCISGYVFLDGGIVANARVTIQNTSIPGTPTITIWTGSGSNSPYPYYYADLNAAPLNVQPGHTLNLSVEYASHYFSTSYIAQANAQQFDLVIPHGGQDDYILDRQIWKQGKPGTFIMHNAAVATDGADTIYVADWVNARIQVFDGNGTFLREWGTLGLASGQLANPSGIAINRQGIVYVADLATQLIHTFTTTGEWLSTWDKRGTNPGQLGLMTDIAVDADGFVYVTEQSGGGTGLTRVQKFTADGTFVAQWGLQGTGPGQLMEPEGLVIANNGDVYVADTGNHRIQRFSSNGTFLGMFGNAGSNAAQFSFPTDIVIAKDGSLYVADSNNGRIKHFSTTGSYLGSFGNYGFDPGQMIQPHGLALNSAGELIITDNILHMVQVFKPDGSFVRRWGGKSDTPERVVHPEGLALDSNNNLYISDGNTGRIKKYTSNGQFLAQFANAGDQNGQLDNPHGVAVDINGNIYVADTGNKRIQVFASDGSYLRQWGSDGDGNGQFREPVGIALDNNANVYVVDSGNHRLQKFSSTGGFLWKLGGPTANAGNGEFNYPRSVAVSPSGSIYVADTNNHRIQMISAQGSYLSRFGIFGANDNQMDLPAGISIGTNGTVFVVDYGRYRFQLYSSNGTWLSNYGWGGVGEGNFDLPARILAGRDGRIYVAENNLGRVQVFRPASYLKPIATISSVSPQSTPPSTAISMRGLAGLSIEDGAPASYSWYLDQSPTPFASTQNATLQTTGLAAGDHTITLRVQSDNQVSEAHTTQITIQGDTTPHRWTMMLYLAGDYPDIANRLGDSSSGVLQRLRNAKLPPNVTILALYDGDGPNDSIRMIFRPGLEPIKEILPEQNMGDPAALISFVRYAKEYTSADAYYLAIADHGSAIDGTAWDLNSASDNSERLTPTELRQALLEVTNQGANPLDILHLDACLMGTFEMAYQLRGMADYLIVSENLAWSIFAYDQYQALAGAATDTATLALGIAERYKQRVAADAVPLTISVLRMQAIDQAARDLDSLAIELERFALIGSDQRNALTIIRDQVQTFDTNNDFRLTREDETVDLLHLTELLASPQLVTDATVRSKSAQLKNSLQEFILSSATQSGQYNSRSVNLSKAQGIAIFFPAEPSMSMYSRYQHDFDFAQSTKWDEFLQPQLTPLGPKSDPGPKPVPIQNLSDTIKIYLSFIRRS